MVYDKVLSILSDGRLALTLGGDHSVGLASLAASLAHYQVGNTVIIMIEDVLTVKNG